jgi:hypothetical protein
MGSFSKSAILSATARNGKLTGSAKIAGMPLPFWSSYDHPNF